jgi:hypothetical protein
MFLAGNWCTFRAQNMPGQWEAETNLMELQNEDSSATVDQLPLQ